ncbi:RNA 2',3'-cyclic phosphodiesterase [Streptomyces sp. NPDC048550]|uniref:RNA 2',3'-cyclic phosphodiesterase n=1 Tax=unclassified Streptomyces TaxID=2593676 RepID=UPI000A5EAA6C|nr:RNA 2',3'-cyclic phosphodiesterase [Streptomyces sp. NBC_00320]MCX5147075.1 RNA 2',3'-cyclic phosphodiesterase [Streptomyces sp. NBC_00320]
MRLFAAVMPPQEAVDELRRAVEAVRSGPAVGQDRAVGHDRLRWTGEAGWHFTLAFMGEVREPVLPDLYARLARAAHRTDPFPLRIHGSGHFGERALWVGAAGGLDQMRMLAERADAAARRAGIPMDQHRRYTPHLTLARSHGGTDLHPHLEALAGFEGTPWQVGELSLVRSNLPTGGVPGEQPRYEVLEAWPLGA